MRQDLSLLDYVKGIKEKNLSILSRAITLVESKNPEHIKLSEELIKEILPLTGSAKRVGVSGTPGVGKSTFLESYGMYLIKKGHSLAVLAVDPTSQVTGGAILGDKTRMHELSASSKAFIRPSPSGSTLGGVAAKTREALLLCDAFGFDFIFVETVGVGQSEVSVSSIVDLFILLMQPGSGDELQGIKRGILEVSDLVIITKADGDQEAVSNIAQHDYQKSLAILQEKKELSTKVLKCSSLYKKGFEEIFQTIEEFFSFYRDKKLLGPKRQKQIENWMQDLIREKISLKMKTEKSFNSALETNIKAVQEGKKSALNAVDELFNILFQK